jgi:hypothetical protein
VRVDRSAPLTTLLLWVGVLGAPLAWTLQLVAGYAAEEADCSRGTSSFDASHGVTVWLSVGAGLVALASLASAALVWRWTQRRPADVRGRVEFMAVAGLLVGALFLALIVLTAVGITHFDPCVAG